MASILVVERDAAARRRLCALLEEHAHEVVETSDVQDASARCTERAFDVVFGSVDLPDVDGVGLMRRVWSVRPATHIVATGSGGVAALDPLADAVQAGAADYLTRPYRPDDVAQILESIARTWAW